MPVFFTYFIVFGNILKDFCVQLFSVLRGHLAFLSPPQRPMTSNFFLSQILSITFFFYLNSSERAGISLFNVECQTRVLLVPFYNVFGMTRSLTGDWTQDLPHSKPALYKLGYRGDGFNFWYNLVNVLCVSVDTSPQPVESIWG